MVFTAEKQLIKRKFNAASSTYNANCRLQNNIADQLIQQVISLRLPFPTVLDVGCGTGLATVRLANAIEYEDIYALDIAEKLLQQCHSSQLNIHPILMCFERFALQAGIADLIFSSMSLQWSQDLPQVFNGMYQALKPDGIMAIALPINSSLFEIRKTLSEHAGQAVGNQFCSREQVLAAAQRWPFHIIETRIEKTILYYDHVLNLVDDLKSIGASRIMHSRISGLRGKHYFQEIDKIYRGLFANANTQLPVTYEILYLLAKKVTSA